MCTHAIARLVQLSQVLFRENGALTVWILISLQSRLQKESYQDILSESIQKQLINAIIQLIKVTGTYSPFYNAGTSIFELLQAYAATTDQEKLLPRKANARDLVLL